jgi:CMP-N,N'-diacetyllegionaminic acid synthase
VARDLCREAAFLISTDCPLMAKEAERHGFAAPFIRPPELATADATSADVIKHAMAWVKEHWKRDFIDIMLLEPSSPFANYVDMSKALAVMAKRDADLVCGMKETYPNSLFVGPMKSRDASITPIVLRVQQYGGGTRRQDLVPEWTMNGALYLFSWSMFERTGDIYGGSRNFGVLMPFWRSIEIDDMHDFEIAQYAHAAGHVELPEGMPLWRRWMDRILAPEMKPLPPYEVIEK